MTSSADEAVFDVHAHLISDDPQRYPHAPLAGIVDASVLEDPMTAERLVAAMPGSAVKRAVAVQRAHVYGIDNRYVVDAASAYPGLLSPLVLVNPVAEDGAASVRRWVGREGAIGVRLTAPSRDGGLAWLSSSAALAVWDAVAAHGASMRVHFYSWNREAGLREVLQLARRYSRISIVLDHLSNVAVQAHGPEYGLDPALQALIPCANISLMFSTINVLRAQDAGLALSPLIARLAEVFGPERLMWGSDVGQSKPAYPDMVQMAREAVAPLSQAARQAVLWGAACRVYGGAAR
ncbi:MAG TPA: amidohydrolase family protein [Steroidobacteraceae bacterium]|nr:amidohydrolase family protein [Steroidobacteraceae bacterium]